MDEPRDSVRPRLVAQIGFKEWTRNGKLRHPRFKGLRRDKRPRDVVRHEPGEDPYRSHRGWRRRVEIVNAGKELPK